MKPDGKCIVPQFTIGRRGYGNVFFDCEIDVANLDIDQLGKSYSKHYNVYKSAIRLFIYCVFLSAYHE